MKRIKSVVHKSKRILSDFGTGIAVVMLPLNKPMDYIIMPTNMNNPTSILTKTNTIHIKHIPGDLNLWS